mgnify:CR=1 FL=1
MERRGQPQPLPRDARMVHARIRLTRKTRTVLLPPLFVLPCLSENSQSTGASSLHPAEHHRPDRITTGTSQFPSAFVGFLGTPDSAGRH